VAKNTRAQIVHLYFPMGCFALVKFSKLSGLN
jgi:hypothetical protein